MAIEYFRGLVVFLILAALLPGCDRDTDKARIERTLAAIRTAAENRDAGAILDRTSKSYGDPQGNDYKKIRGTLLMYFFRYQGVKVIMTGLETDIQEASAEARFEAILSGRTGPSASVLPEALGAYRFTVLLALESGEWKVTSAVWERIGDGLQGTQ